MARSQYKRGVKYNTIQHNTIQLGRGGVGVCSVPCSWRVAGSNPPQKQPRRDPGQVLHSQLLMRFCVKLRLSVRAVVGSASEWEIWCAHLFGGNCLMILYSGRVPQNFYRTSDQSLIIFGANEFCT